MLLDQLLIAAGTNPRAVAGPELTSHLETALAVASGIADAALGLRASVTDLGLEFIPLTWESYDVVLDAAALGAARPLITAVTDPDVQTAMDVSAATTSATPAPCTPSATSRPPPPTTDTLARSGPSALSIDAPTSPRSPAVSVRGAILGSWRR